MAGYKQSTNLRKLVTGCWFEYSLRHFACLRFSVLCFNYNLLISWIMSYTKRPVSLSIIKSESVKSRVCNYCIFFFCRICWPTKVSLCLFWSFSLWIKYRICKQQHFLLVYFRVRRAHIFQEHLIILDTLTLTFTRILLWACLQAENTFQKHS